MTKGKITIERDDGVKIQFDGRLENKDIYAANVAGIPDMDLAFTTSPEQAAARHRASLFRDRPQYAIPAHIPGPQDRDFPSHAGILHLIREAKDAGHIWADCALGELAMITGVNYTFVRRSAFDFQKHEIEVRR